MCGGIIRFSLQASASVFLGGLLWSDCGCTGLAAHMKLPHSLLGTDILKYNVAVVAEKMPSKHLLI